MSLGIFLNWEILGSSGKPCIGWCFCFVGVLIRVSRGYSIRVTDKEAIGLSKVNPIPQTLSPKSRKPQYTLSP